MDVLAVAADPFEEVRQEGDVGAEIASAEFLHPVDHGVVAFGLLPHELEAEVGQGWPLVLI